MDINNGAKIIVNDWLKAKRDEVLHFITDENHIKEAEAFERAAIDCGAVTKITLLPSNKVQEGNIIDEMQNTMYYSDAVIGATHFSFITTSAVEYSLKKGSRFLSLPMHTNDNSSIFESEFLQMSTYKAKKIAKSIIRKLKRAKQIIVKTGLGTDVVFSKINRDAGYFNGVCSRKKSIGSASFEVYVPIIENATRGRIVVDGSLGYIGLVKKPFEITLENGYIKGIENSIDGKKLKQYIESFTDKEMLCAAEFGIGLNEKSRCRGVSYVEDESAYGTFHVGFGRNLALGGKHDAEGHFDIVIHNPDIWADGVQVMEKGNVCPWFVIVIIHINYNDKMRKLYNSFYLDF